MRRIDYMRMLHQVDAVDVEDLYSDFPSASWIREPSQTSRVAFLAGEETTGDANVADDAAPNAARPDAPDHSDKTGPDQTVSTVAPAGSLAGEDGDGPSPVLCASLDRGDLTSPAADAEHSQAAGIPEGTAAEARPQSALDAGPRVFHSGTGGFTPAEGEASRVSGIDPSLLDWLSDLFGGGPGGKDPGDSGNPDGTPPGPAPDAESGNGPDSKPSDGPGSDGDDNDIFDDIGDAIDDAFDWLDRNVSDPVSDAWDDATDWLSERADEASQFAEEMWSDASEYAKEKWDSATEYLSEQYDKAVSELSRLRDLASEYSSDVADYLDAKITEMGDIISQGYNQAADTISNLANQALDLGQSALNSAGDAVSAAYDFAANAIASATSWTAQKISEIYQAGHDAVVYALDAVGDALSTGAQSALDGLRAVGDAIDSVGDAIVQGFSETLESFQKLGNLIPTVVGAGAGAAYEVLGDLAKAAGSTAGSLVIKAHGNVLSNLYTVADAVMDGSTEAYALAVGGILGSSLGSAVAVGVAGAILGTAVTAALPVFALAAAGAIVGGYIGTSLAQALFVDPLVIDLDGDGVELLNGVESGVTFDVDSDGYAESTGWVAPDDGFLARDLNGNGKIDDARELFSNTTGSATTGFGALAALDANGDGKIDQNDPAFGQLVIWQDANGNGKTDAGELKTLTELGITSISLDKTAVNASSNGNLVLSTGTVTLNDGQTRTIAEVGLGHAGDGMRVIESGEAGGVIELETGKLVQRLDPGADAPIVAGDDVAVIFGTNHGDTVSGGSDAVWIDGGAGNDVLAGSALGDILIGGAGVDALAGGAGDDTIVVDAADDLSAVSGGEGVDRLFVEGPAGVVADLGAMGVEAFYGSSGADRVSTSGQEAIVVQAGGGDDVVTGGGGDDILAGQDGNDTLTGGAGTDVARFAGRASDYTVTTVNGITTVVDLRQGTGNEGTDTLTGIERLVFSDSVRHLDNRNEAPMTRPDAAVFELGDGVITLKADDLLGNDVDVDRDALTITGIRDVQGGTVWLTEGGDIRFAAAPGFAGTASFTYVVSDGHGGSALGSVEIEVEARDPADGVGRYQWHLTETNVTKVWPDYTGVGVVIGIADEGVDDTHPDIAPNYDHDVSWEHSLNNTTRHGTVVAGVAAGARDDEGIIGVAYDAGIADFQGFDRFIATWASYEQNSAELSHVDVVNNSWGMAEDFRTTGVFGLLPLSWTTEGMENLTTYGRDGLGTNIVFAAGNERLDGSRADYDLFVNSRYSIAVGSVDYYGDGSTFSRPGASVLIAAPGEYIVSSDLPGSSGYSSGGTLGGDYYSASGTSVAAPVVSGIIAMMLEANPDLGWRDVQAILSYSAYRADIGKDSAGWRFNGAHDWNGGGLAFRDDVGFGYIDALAAVRLAETWTLQSTSANEVSATAGQGADLALADGGSVTSSVTISQNIEIGHITLDIVLDHSHIGDLIITLTSPDGTVSTFVDRPGKAPGDSTDTGTSKVGLDFSFSSVQFRGEASAGTWTLTVTDARTGDTGILRDWSIGIHGDAADADDLYVFTNQFSNVPGADPRQTYTLTDGQGTDTINAAAVNTDITLDLRSGGAIDGRGIRIAEGTSIENVYAGDGDDILAGTGAANTLSGGRGDDLLMGNGGADALIGGQGIDTASFTAETAGLDVNLATGASSRGDRLSGIENVIGGSGDDAITGDAGDNLLVGADGADTLTGGAGTDLLLGGGGTDAIFGGDGDDAIDAGSGDDSVDGGLGWDVLNISGNRSDYVLTAAGGHHTLTWAQGSIQLTGIEAIEFADGTLALDGNLKPTAAADAFAMTRGEILVLRPEDLLGNDHDPEGAALHIVGVGHAVGGTVSLGADGLIRFRTDPSFTGQASFQYALSDGRTAETSAQVGITVSADSRNLVVGTAGQDRLNGTDGHDKIVGSWGVDVLVGGAGDDELAGQEQNDRMLGGAGNDVYRFGRGDGVDWILDNEGANILRLAPGLLPSSVTVRFVTNSYDAQGNTLYGAAAADGRKVLDLYLDFGAGDYVILHDFLSGAVRTISSVAFADGTSWSAAYIASAALIGTDRNDVIEGTSSGEYLSGSQGDDRLESHAGEDSLDGGTGNDRLLGGAGGDAYLYLAGDGTDTIVEHAAAGDTDVLVFGPGLLAAEMIVLRPAADLNDAILQFTGTAGSITLDGQFLGNGAGLETIYFADGTTWTAESLRLAFLEQARTSGNDTIHGFYTDDIIAGGAGDDRLLGLAGNDMYSYGPGDGNDTIVEAAAGGGADRLLLGVGLTAAGAIISRTAADLSDATLRFAGAEGSIFLDGQFLGGGAGLEQIAFADGTTWSAADLMAQYIARAQTAGDDSIWGFSNGNILSGGAGNDTLDGLGGADTLIGGSGNDLLIGGDGSDIYVYEMGDGDDTVSRDATGGSTDTLRLGAGIGSDGITIERPSGDIDDARITVLGAAGSILLDEQFADVGGNAIDRIEFDDGTSWTAIDLRLRYLERGATASNDTLHGFSSNDSIRGNSGDDRLFGQAGDDALAGDAGHDELRGDGGSDTYSYNAGDGNDLIIEGADPGDADRLVFGAGLDAADLIVTQSATDLDDITLSFRGQAGSIALDEQLAGGGYGIEQIVFGDGTTWARADLEAAYLAQVLTAGNDTIYGFAGATTFRIRALAGDDRIIEGRAPDDIDRLVFGAGLNAADLVVTRTAGNLDDVTFRFLAQTGSITLDEQFAGNGYGIEQILFGDGTTWTKADIETAYIAQAQTAGDDTIYGFAGATTFRIQALAGNDRIVEDQAANDIDRLVFGAGLDAADVIVTRATSAFGMTLGFLGQTGSITLDRQDAIAGGYGFEQIVFGDGVVWSRADLLGAYIAQAQTAGNDTIYGFDGETTFAVAQLAGADKIVEGYGPNDSDRLVFGTSLDVADVIVTRTAGAPYDAILSFQGHAGSITLVSQFYGSGEGIEQIVFGDGTAWTKADLRATYVTRAITAGSDTVFGFVGGDSLDGAAGNDVVDGLAGDDTLFGGAGRDVLQGSEGDDRLAGGADTDTLRGGSGGDTYIYARGDGSDTIADGSSSASDTLSLGEGIAQEVIQLSRSNADINDLVIRFAGSQDSIVIDGQLLANGSGVEQILFADGSSWSAAEIAARLLAQAGTPADETIIGTALADVIRGAGGDDNLNGKGGGDAYVYGLGDGDDVITEGSSLGTADIDTLVLGAGIDADTLTVIRPASGNIDDLVLLFADNSGSITLTRQIWGSGYGIELVIFHDGTVWTGEDLKIRYLESAGTSGDDFIRAFDDSDDTVHAGAGMDYVYGFSGDDVLNGGAGRDFIFGDRGNDVYLYSIGNEEDSIIEASGATGDTDVLRFGAGLSVADIVVTSLTTTSTSATISFVGHAGEITIYSQFLSGPGDGIERFEFADGTVWTSDDLRDYFLDHFGNSGPDVLTGTAADDVLDGGPGYDTLDGREGADQLIGGEDFDTVTYAESPVGVTVDLMAGTASGGFAEGDTLSGIEWVVGSQYDDVITGDAGDNQIVGYAGADRLAGGAGTDILGGMVGDDILDGGEGDDYLVGDVGDDTYFVDSASDVVAEDANAGFDTVVSSVALTLVDNVEELRLTGAENLAGTGNSLANTLFGNSGANDLRGMEGDDVLDGMGGGDRLDGGAGVDTASYDSAAIGVVIDLAAGTASGGDAQGDVLVGIENLSGSQGSDTLVGSTGANALQGWSGNDVLRGGAGADVLNGGIGADALTGGTGNDTFAYASAADSTVAAAGKDAILDFTAGDRIDLSAIDADGNAGNGDTAFTLGTGNFTGPGQIRVLAFENNRYGVYLEIDGDKVQDAIINVYSDHALTVGDFVL
jgi:Ca2+-binding RTX toxin-like protein/subtilisin-like proprotein convertase family protein